MRYFSRDEGTESERHKLSYEEIEEEVEGWKKYKTYCFCFAFRNRASAIRVH